MANEAMRHHWTFVAGPEWLELEDDFDRSLHPFGVELLLRVRAAVGDRVLDVGCGFGATTIAIAGVVGPGGQVAGLDLSAPLLARAQSRAMIAGLTNVAWREEDAQTADLPAGHFDLVVSRFGVMFFEDPVIAFANLAGALKPGGRLGFACWGPRESNPWYTWPARTIADLVELPDPPPPESPGPFSLADPQRIHDVLGAAGFVDLVIERLEIGFVQGPAGGVDAALRHMVRGTVAAALAAAPPTSREAALARLRESLAEHLVDGTATFPSAVWLVQARRSS